MPSLGPLARLRQLAAGHPQASIWHDIELLRGLLPDDGRHRLCVAYVEVGEQTRACLPYCLREGLLGSVVTEPPLWRYSAPLFAADAGQEEQRELLLRLLDALPSSLGSIDLNLPPSAAHLLQGVDVPGFLQRERSTYLANTARSEEELFARVSKRRRRHLRRAARYWAAVTVDALDSELHVILAAPFVRQGLRLPYDPERLDRILAALLPKGKALIHVLLHPDGRPGAVLVSLLSERDGYLWLAGDVEDARAEYGGHLVYWEGILGVQRSGRPQLDCLGSDLRGPAEQRRSLGAYRVPYVHVWRDRHVLRRVIRRWRGRKLKG